MKLQTLADFERELGRTKDKQFLVNPDHIRNMAKEHIKDIDRKRRISQKKWKELSIKNNCDYGVDYTFDKIKYDSQIEWIKMFFKEYEEEL